MYSKISSIDKYKNEKFNINNLYEVMSNVYYALINNYKIDSNNGELNLNIYLNDKSKDECKLLNKIKLEPDHDDVLNEFICMEMSKLNKLKNYGVSVYHNMTLESSFDSFNDENIDTKFKYLYYILKTPIIDIHTLMSIDSKITSIDVICHFDNLI